MSAAITFQVAREATSSRLSQAIWSRPRNTVSGPSALWVLSVFGPR
jgi:hypothetical protein